MFPWHLTVLLTIVAQIFDIPRESKNVESKIVVHRVEVGWAMELATVQPANEDCSTEFVKISERQLLLGGWSLRGQKLPEVRNLVKEKVVVCLEGLLGWSGEEGGLLKLTRRGSFLSGVLGVDGRDQGSTTVSLGYSSERMAY